MTCFWVGVFDSKDFLVPVIEQNLIYMMIIEKSSNEYMYL